MTLQLNNVKGTFEAMDALFENGGVVSVRYYAPTEKQDNAYNISIRCSDEVGALLKGKKSITAINKVLTKL